MKLSSEKLEINTHVEERLRNDYINLGILLWENQLELSLLLLKCLPARGQKTRPMGQILPTTSFCINRNKVLLKHSHTHRFIDYLQLLSYYSGRIYQLQKRPYDLQKQKYLLSDSVKKKFADSCFIYLNLYYHVCFCMPFLDNSSSSKPFVKNT